MRSAVNSAFATAAAVSILALLGILNPNATAIASQPPSFLTMWGSAGSGEGQIQDGMNLAVTPAGDVYLAELGNARIQQFTSTGTFVRMWSVPNPWGVAVALDGSVYVASESQIYKYSSSGVYQTGWGTAGNLEGQFHDVLDVAVDGDGNVYAADAANHRIQKFTADGVFLLAWPVQGAGNGFPQGITVGPDGYVYVADEANQTIQKFSRGGSFVVAWSLPDGAPIGRPVVSPQGDVYVPDRNAHRIVLCNPDGIVQMEWGTFGTGPGQFETPNCVSMDSFGNFYVMDYWNARVQKFGPIITSTRDRDAAPIALMLERPVPNPTSHGISVRFAVPHQGRADLSVFDVAGRLVARILDDAVQPGWRYARWDGRDQAGHTVASGTYFLRLTAGQTVTRRLVVLR
jgi:DNA-binding beta-propeller fold protein YncE